LPIFRHLVVCHSVRVPRIANRLPYLTAHVPQTEGIDLVQHFDFKGVEMMATVVGFSLIHFVSKPIVCLRTTATAIFPFRFRQ
jgi:hypothetical protein